MSTSKERMNKNMIAWYPFDDASDAGRDASGHNNTAVAKGTQKPVIKKVCGRNAAVFQGGTHGASYFELPENILKDVSDEGGFTISTWICCKRTVDVWERIIDFGNGNMGPYLFLTRFLRGVCFAGSDIYADAGHDCPLNEWMHVAMTVTGTKGGSLSSAGPRIYLNGELMVDGFISQTSSGTYKMLREWFKTLDNPANYGHNYIGHSQFPADADFCGAMSDFRLFKDALSEVDIIGLMCESLSEEDILKLAKDKFLLPPRNIITRDIKFQHSLMEDRVQVSWSCDHPDIISNTGEVSHVETPSGVCITAELKCGSSSLQKDFVVTVMPKKTAAYEITIHGNNEVLDISKTLYGLFYEDINNAADGGIYAEMVQNRSFEEFSYKVYDAASGENGKSSGRLHNPVRFWFGDLEKATVRKEGGLNEHFHLTDPDVNAYYIEVESGAKLYNRGFCDNNLALSMNLLEGNSYQLTIWAKSEKGAKINVSLQDAKHQEVSNQITIDVNDNGWKKYTADKLTASQTVMGQLALEFEGDAAIDMVSLMPDNVWGANEEDSSKTAHTNFLCNSNYRLRRDLMQVLTEMHPTFLRFPGGCISEGSYIWENVYDWKESVGDVEVRKENYNVWGYMMTLGLGYMEYFQMAEDLNAEPLPVMACGVLCQARSDYANPAGGSLQEKYINNFTDLIDFAISTDFEKNEWAALRKSMGHEAPFGLHYLGVGNENWGEEFFASFEAFKHAIDLHMEKNYPDYELHIISTAGAQADDDAYKEGWKFLAGYMKGGASVRFTDGEKSFEKDVTWYPYEKNYLGTIVDEHYYRANDYLLENADRYNYYYRAYENGKLVEDQVSKVFVGEYASSDKNTLAGAVAEAAVMTGFERNSDVVRLAATAPLFNKVVSDATYRWTPDAIWFDNDSVWRTPNFYVQQMFAENIGEKLLETSYYTYEAGRKKLLEPCGGVSIAVAEGEAVFKKLTVVSNETNETLFEQDFSKELNKALLPLSIDEDHICTLDGGLKVIGDSTRRRGYYLNQADWKNYTVTVSIEKLTENTQIFVGAGLQGVSDKSFSTEKLNLLEYCVGYGNDGTGLKVFKDGKEGYTMGDYSSSVFAGNLRACYDEPVPAGQEYQVTFNYGGENGKSIHCFYTGKDGVKKAPLDCKLESYNRDIYHSVTKDSDKVYIKLVNADYFDKILKVSLQDLAVEAQAEAITLTGDVELLHLPNINIKEAENIAPVSREIEVPEDGFEIMVPASSVNVVVLNLK